MKILTNNFILLCLLIPAGSVFAQDMDSRQAEELFRQANYDFRQANQTEVKTEADRLYQKAILAYEAIIDKAEIYSPGLYYNLANSYMLKGDIGRAILNYRRSQRLDQSDPYIQKNLDFARSMRVDKIEMRVEKKVISRLFFWHYDFSTIVKFYTSMILFVLICILISVRIWYSRIPGLKGLTAILCIVFICMSVSVAADQYIMANYKSGVIVADQVIARQGDGDNYEFAFKDPLHSGTEFEVIEQRPGWIHISLSNGNDAWIPEASAGII